jgi:hypothetical protein
MEIQEDFKRLKSSVEHSELSVAEASKLNDDYRQQASAYKE